MTLQTSLIVISCVLTERLLRIVTRDAADISIVRITLALKNPVRLKTNVVDFQTLQQRKLFRAAMTRCTKMLRQLIATEQTGIVNRLRRRIAFLHRRDMSPTWSMTSFASHSVR